MEKYIVPPSNPINPVERYEDGKWVRIEFIDVKKGDILRVYDHEYKPCPVGKDGIVIATSNGFTNDDGIPTFIIETNPEKIPNI